MHQIIQFLFFLGAVQGFLLTAFLFSIKSNKLSNIFLGLLTFSWGLILLDFPIQEYGIFIKHPHLLKIIPNLLLIVSPLLYLYIKYLLSEIKRVRSIDLVHAIPYVVYTLFLIPFYIKSGPEKLELASNKDLYLSILDIIASEIISIQGLLYSFLAFKRLRKYDTIIEDYQSTVYKTPIKVLKIGTILVFLAWVLGGISIHLEYIELHPNINLFRYVYLILVLVIYIISYMSLKTPEIFKLQEGKFGIPALIKFTDGKNSLDDDNDEDDDKVADGNQDKETDFLLEKLEVYMIEEKPYLNPELSLQELASRLEMGRNQLSALINQNHQMNFFEFVNLYRVNEVKALMELPENQKLKLISIAYDAGFNSKSSFNRIFKNQTQMTPSEYFKSIILN